MKKNHQLDPTHKSLTSLKIGDVIFVDKNWLESIEGVIDALTYQIPSAVTGYISHSSEGYTYTYEICPKCACVLEHSYQAYCENCGQRLKWISRKKMTNQSGA